MRRLAILLLSMTAVGASDPFELLRKIDDPELPFATRQANVAMVAQKAVEQPLLCAELARRIGFRGSAFMFGPVVDVLTDPEEFCGQHLVDTIGVLRGTDDDTDDLYIALTKEQLLANPGFVTATLRSCGSFRALVVAVLAARYGLTDRVDEIAQCVIRGAWSPDEEIRARVPEPHIAATLTQLWQLNYGPILLSLRTSENQALVDEALKVIHESLTYRHGHLEKDEDPELGEVELLRDISEVLGR